MGEKILAGIDGCGGSKNAERASPSRVAKIQLPIRENKITARPQFWPGYAVRNCRYGILMDKEALFPSANALPAHRRYSLGCEHPVRNSAHSSTFLEPNRFKSAQQIGEGKDDAMRKARRIRWLTGALPLLLYPRSVVIGSQPDSKSCESDSRRTIRRWPRQSAALP